MSYAIQNTVMNHYVSLLSQEHNYARLPHTHTVLPDAH